MAAGSVWGRHGLAAAGRLRERGGRGLQAAVRGGGQGPASLGREASEGWMDKGRKEGRQAGGRRG